MNLHKFTRLGLAALLATVIPAVIRADDAKLIKKSGSVSISGVKSGELNEGDLIPQGATITTASGAEAFVLTAPGTVANLKSNTEVSFDKLSISKNSSGAVKAQTTHLNLRHGSVVALIDHSMKDVNDFRILTPQGVAVAKGTAFSIVVDGSVVTIVTTANSVSFTRSSGADLEVSSGYAAVLSDGSSGAAQPLSSLVASNPDVAASLPAVISALSSMLSGSVSSGNLSATALTELSSQVVAAASTANPSQAASYTSQIATAMASPNSAVSETAGSAIATVAASAAAAAPNAASEIAVAATEASPSSVGIIAPAVAQTSGTSLNAIISSITQATGTTTAQIQAQINLSGNLAAAAASSAVNPATVTPTAETGAAPVTPAAPAAPATPVVTIPTLPVIDPTIVVPVSPAS